jgi:hypothetical protein
MGIWLLVMERLASRIAASANREATIDCLVFLEIWHLSAAMLF